MNPSENKRPVSLEDLVRLKRAERPSPDFWARFESELRAKQLAAIVEKRQWWQIVSLTDFLRHRVALGVAAALTLGAFSFAEYQVLAARKNSEVSTGATIALSSFESPNSVAMAGDIPTLVFPPAISANGLVSPRNLSGESSESPIETVAISGPLKDASSGIPNGVVMSSADRRLPTVDVAERLDLSPVAQLIANNLAAAKEAHPELTNRFFGVSGFEKRGVPSGRQMIDPLAQMRSPSELHRERLLASVTPAALSSSAPRGNERVARRISDQRLTEESMTRFDARGNEFSLKF